MNKAEKERLLGLLPERMPDRILRWALREHREELGGEYLSWKAVRFEPSPAFASLGHLSQGERQGGAVRGWRAEVTCSACGEWFYTAGGGRSFFLGTGPDECTYPVMEEHWDGYCDGDFIYTEIAEGDEAVCPNCGESCRVMHSRSLRNGRQKQLMVVSVETLGEYAAVVCWMVERMIYTAGTVPSGRAIAAFVLGENGRLHTFKHSQGSGLGGTLKITNDWQSARSGWGCIDMIYHDWGSIANRKQGAVIYPECPALEGTTGEKTGLEAMTKSGFTAHLTDYLRRWKEAKGLENLANQGWTYLLADIAEQGFPMSGFRWDRMKPHEILNMPKEHYRNARKDGGVKRWSRQRWRVYHKIMQLHPGIDWETWAAWDGFFGRRLEQAAEFPEGLGKVMHYLQKQQESGEAVVLLTDARRMAEQLYERQLTEEELWPRNLREQHDRLDMLLRQRRNEMKAADYAEGFRQIKEQYGGLEWNDGELCILLPMSNSELVKEGDVLRHCVGGYGDRHVQKTGSIWFVRHYRRPERSYYTLNINLISGAEIQLHGYGNERHGPRKQYRHKIPKKVRDFVDRWETEVLTPFLRQKQDKERTA